ncbi:hypothetical protein DSCOOX_21560 [Desulfosarcina ovata subsp. ovata]|uniref:Uncharacterized protein n=1 Tax=Desulfosarcina ovata subsp. ovata TaxID=2752305 RepID=A0A5K8A932_9BACT|nr:hypothetical protein DSCOOX_21560 [Desulfosarcina ovata subsp. ovata]
MLARVTDVRKSKERLKGILLGIAIDGEYWGRSSDLRFTILDLRDYVHWFIGLNKEKLIIFSIYQ